MRYFLVLALLVGLGADAKANMCEEVHRRSARRISCTKDDFGYTLKYQDWFARKLTLASGQHHALIESLCLEGGVVRETWPKPFGSTQLRITHCVAGE